MMALRLPGSDSGDRAARLFKTPIESVEAVEKAKTGPESLRETGVLPWEPAFLDMGRFS